VGGVGAARVTLDGRVSRAEPGSSVDQSATSAARRLTRPCSLRPRAYASNENGNAPFSYRRAKEYASALGVRPEWLYDAAGPMRGSGRDGLVPIIGRVGANPEGTVLFAHGHDAGDLAPIPPGGTDSAVALQVVGHSMHGFADDGALIYFEDQRTPPTPDMLGHVVVVASTPTRCLSNGCCADPNPAATIWRAWRGRRATTLGCGGRPTSLRSFPLIRRAGLSAWAVEVDNFYRAY